LRVPWQATRTRSTSSALNSKVRDSGMCPPTRCRRRRPSSWRQKSSRESRLTAGQGARVDMTTGESLHGTVVAADATSITLLVARRDRRVASEQVQKVSIVRDLDESRRAVMDLTVGVRITWSGGVTQLAE